MVCRAGSPKFPQFYIKFFQWNFASVIEKVEELIFVPETQRREIVLCPSQPSATSRHAIITVPYTARGQHVNITGSRQFHEPVCNDRQEIGLPTSVASDDDDWLWTAIFVA